MSLSRTTTSFLRQGARAVLPVARPLPVTWRYFHYSPVAARLSPPEIQKFTERQNIAYDELKKITDMPSDDVLVIDVREPEEVMLGSVPSSVNLPLSAFEKALAMDESDFLRKYGFRKPEKTQPMVFYCKAGKRSETALDLAKKAGFKATRNYEGSWLDWSSRQRKSPNDDD